MSFCDFAENVEDAIDQGCAYDYEEETSKQQGTPQLLWLSDIPLFQSVKAMKPGGHSYLTEDDNDSELQCTYQSSRVAYRDESGFYGPGTQTGPWSYVEQAGSLDSDDEEEDEEDEQEAKLGPDGKIIRVLEDTPDWYEKYTSFLCQKDPEVVLLTLKEMLQCDDRITFEIPDTHYQIRGSIILEERATAFHINIFKDTMPNECLVEFQRQSGSAPDFLAFYRQCVVHLNNNFEDFLVAKFLALSTGVFNFSPRAATA